MQRLVSTSLDFINFSPERKVPIGTGMINGISGDTNTFPNPPVDVKTLGELNNDLNGDIPKAKTGDKQAGAELVITEKKWDDAFRRTAKYVGTVANGNEAIIRQGGCTPTKNETSPAQVPGECKNVMAAAEHGHSTATMGCDADEAIKGYLFLAATSGATVKQDGDMLVITVGSETVYIKADTHRKTIMHNLAGGTRLSMSMLAFNTAGCGPLSSAQTVIPQE